MPPPQCPECGRFLARAFVARIKDEPEPCPRCGTELSLADGDEGPGAVTPEEPPPAATLPSDVEPEPQTSVRPPDLHADRDPLEGWDESPAVSAPRDTPDPAVVAAGAGVGLLLGLLLGGRDHRGLGALLGAALGAAGAGLCR